MCLYAYLSFQIKSRSEIQRWQQSWFYSNLCDILGTYCTFQKCFPVVHSMKSKLPKKTNYCWEKHFDQCISWPVNELCLYACLSFQTRSHGEITHTWQQSWVSFFCNTLGTVLLKSAFQLLTLLNQNYRD